jgi:hypothetical protein
MVAIFSGSSISSPLKRVDQPPSAATHAADDLAGFSFEPRKAQGREGRRAEQGVATLIRHAHTREAPPVLPLAVAVVEPPFLTPLVPAVGRTTLLAPRLAPTPLGAVPLAPIAGAAYVEHRTASLPSAKTLVEKDLLGVGHRTRTAGLDN